MASLESNEATVSESEAAKRQRRQQKKAKQRHHREKAIEQAIKYTEGHTLADGSNSVVLIADIFYRYTMHGQTPKKKTK